MSKWCRSILLVLPLLVGLSTSAHAGFLYFTYSYTGNGIASAGLFTTTDVAVGGAYTITDIQGTRNVDDITGLLVAGAFGANDNLLFAGGPFVDTAGFSFQANSLSYNVGNSAAACGSANQYAETNNGFCPGTAVSMVVTAFSPDSSSSYFAYSYVGDGIASAGILTTTAAGAGGPYAITDIQALRNGVDIATLLAPGAFGANDNLIFFPGGPFVDTAGFSYQAAGLNYNVGNSASACGSANQYAETNNGFCPGTAVSMNVVALRVPEPASLLLIGIGLLGLGVGARRKTIKT